MSFLVSCQNPRCAANPLYFVQQLSIADAIVRDGAWSIPDRYYGPCPRCNSYAGILMTGLTNDFNRVNEIIFQSGSSLEEIRLLQTLVKEMDSQGKSLNQIAETIQKEFPKLTDLTEYIKQNTHVPWWNNNFLIGILSFLMSASVTIGVEVYKSNIPKLRIEQRTTIETIEF